MLAASLACASPAAAATVPAPAAPPAKPHVKLSFRYGFSVARQEVTIPHRSLNVRGQVRPYEAGQYVSVFAYLDGRLLKRAKLLIRHTHGTNYGGFYLTLSAPNPGEVLVVVKHHTTSKLAGFTVLEHYAVLNDNVSFGSTGRYVQLIQQQLAALHFYLPQTGVYDAGTGLAIDAYHRLLRRGTSQTLDSYTRDWLLNGWGSFGIRFPQHGAHAEGNLSDQLLALANGNRVYWIFPISSGKPSTPTILGDFHVYLKTPWSLPDGMYFSNFFWGGYAIHGYNPAPDYPASHGCMRVPMADAVPIYNWLGLGDWVDVYY